MNPEQAFSHIVMWVRRVVLVGLLLLITAWLAARFGVRLPMSTPDHVALAYVAGAYWLTK
jgi:hypothetical protein